MHAETITYTDAGIQTPSCTQSQSALTVSSGGASASQSGALCSWPAACIQQAQSRPAPAVHLP